MGVVDNELMGVVNNELMGVVNNKLMGVVDNEYNDVNTYKFELIFVVNEGHKNSQWLYDSFTNTLSFIIL